MAISFLIGYIFISFPTNGLLAEHVLREQRGRGGEQEKPSLEGPPPSTHPTAAPTQSLSRTSASALYLPLVKIAALQTKASVMLRAVQTKK